MSKNQMLKTRCIKIKILKNKFALACLLLSQMHANGSNTEEEIQKTVLVGSL